MRVSIIGLRSEREELMSLGEMLVEGRRDARKIKSAAFELVVIVMGTRNEEGFIPSGDAKSEVRSALAASFVSPAPVPGIKWADWVRMSLCVLSVSEGAARLVLFRLPFLFA